MDSAHRIGFCIFDVNAGIYYTNSIYASIDVENAESDWILPAESDWTLRQNRIGFCPQNQIVSELPNRVNSMLGLMAMIQLNSAGGSRIECIVIVTVD